MAKQTTTDLDRVSDQITDAVQHCAPAQLSQLPAMKQAVQLSKGIQALRNAITEDVMREVFLPLRGSHLGFRTDRDEMRRDDKRPPYTVGEIRDALIEGMLKGLRPVGNEINVIGGRCYVTKEGVERLVLETPGLTHLELEPGAPVMKDGEAKVAYRATWKLHGKRMEMVKDIERDGDRIASDRRIIVRLNAGMGPDAALGKAKRKMLAAILERLTGIRLEDGDDSEGAIETEGQEVRPSPTAALVERQRARREEKPEASPITGDDGELYDPATGERIPT